jgi:hypothetical protein
MIILPVPKNLVKKTGSQNQELCNIGKDMARITRQTEKLEENGGSKSIRA